LDLIRQTSSIWQNGRYLDIGGSNPPVRVNQKKYSLKNITIIRITMSLDFLQVESGSNHEQNNGSQSGDQQLGVTTPGTGVPPAGMQKPVGAERTRRQRTQDTKPTGKTESLSYYPNQTDQSVEYLSITLTPEEFRGYLKGNIIAHTSTKDVEDYAKALVYTRLLNEFVTTGKITVTKEE
jgi:hypothetical protein